MKNQEKNKKLIIVKKISRRKGHLSMRKNIIPFFSNLMFFLFLIRFE
jgi:hypothetical protein